MSEWQPSQRYPDPSVVVVDESFARYKLNLAKVERLATGFRWAEGPVWFGDLRCLLWSDIPNNRIMRWDEETGQTSIFRKPSNFANGNTRDRQGRLVTCLHGGRSVIRTEHDGTITTIADRYDGKRLNSPNDIVVKSDGSIWFTDPPFGLFGNYEGYKAEPEGSITSVYRVDGATGALSVVADDVNGPNGLAFSPDESKLYVVEVAGDAAHDHRATTSSAARSSRTSARSSTRGRRGRPTASASTSTATSGAAGAWVRKVSTACTSSTPTAS